MLKNYLLVCVRNLSHQRLYSAIKIFGLGLGIACCVPMLLQVYYGLNHDAFHENGDDIYRVLGRLERGGGEIRLSGPQPIALAPALVEAHPGIVRATSYLRSQTSVGHGDKKFWQQFALVDPDFLRMFSFPLLAGDPATALERRDGVVIDEAVARKFFGAADYSEILGERLSFASGRGPQDFVVTGVMAPVPRMSSLEFQLLVRVEHYAGYPHNNESWGGVDATASVYAQLAPGQSPRGLAAALAAVAGAQLGPMIAGMKADGYIRDGDGAFSFALQPLGQVHFAPEVYADYEKTADPQSTYALAGIALLVLCIACINFTTLTVGQSVRRMREAGMRKVLGARRGQLLGQFWGEAFIASLLALVLGLALAELFMRQFGELAQTAHLGLFAFDPWHTLAGLLGLLAAVTLMSGAHPALVVARFQPIEALKARVRLGGRSRFMRALVVVQFALSIALMTGAALMRQQLEYTRGKDLGFAREEVLVVSLRGPDTLPLAERYKQSLLQSPRVLAAATSDRSFTDGSSRSRVARPDGQYVGVRLIRVDADYLDAMGIALKAGRDLVPADGRGAILVNERLVEAFGWDDPVGQTLWRSDAEPVPRVVGVVKDYHIDSLHGEIEPLVLHMRDPNNRISVMVRLRPGPAAESLDFLRERWQALAPGGDHAAQFAFLDRRLDGHYRTEAAWADLVGYAFAFALLLSCLGLWGLVSLAVARQTREIGIRKVLGAGVADVIAMLSGDFVKLVLAANVLSWPLVYYGAGRWLEQFAYRIEIGPGVFALCGAAALAVALATLVLQTAKAALANPVDALRNE